MNSCLKKLLYLITLSFIYVTPIFSQENQVSTSKIPPISLYGSVGFSGAWVAASGYIEGIITTPSHINPFFRIGITGATGFALGTHLAIEGGILFGKGKSHLEIAGGWHYGFSKWYDFYPYGGSIGYRYQKPDGILIFRTGIGYTEGIYAGIGVCLKS